MAEDSRDSGRPHSGVQIIPSNDANLHTVIELRDEETLAIDEISVEYDEAGSVEAIVEIHDEPSTTTNGNEDELLDKFHIGPGETINPDMVWSDIEDDVLVTTDGNLDAEIVVTVGGYKVTG